MSAAPTSKHRSEVRLARYPEGLPVADDFEFARVPLPQLAAGQILVRNLFMSVDPSMRIRMTPDTGSGSYLPPFDLGSALGWVHRLWHRPPTRLPRRRSTRGVRGDDLRSGPGRQYPGGNQMTTVSTKPRADQLVFDPSLVVRRVVALAHWYSPPSSSRRRCRR
ncbi:hypothetical protein [Dietzia aurantiaca]|uniref:Oxidoreductase N-terminal domain-containing protein n=1 Tax=Dietzia aurantiaca TaxID=983873 RepID=A0ABV9PMP4_9ACTN